MGCWTDSLELPYRKMSLSPVGILARVQTVVGYGKTCFLTDSEWGGKGPTAWECAAAVRILLLRVHVLAAIQMN